MSEAANEANGPAEPAQGMRRLGNRAIGDRLRQLYVGVVEEPIPEHFSRLLDEAEATERENVHIDDFGR